MDKYNFNSSTSYSLNNQSSDGMFNRIMSAGGNINYKTLQIVGFIILGIIVGALCYYYFVL